MTLTNEIIVCHYRLWIYRMQMNLAVVCVVAGFVMCLLGLRGVGSAHLGWIVMIIGFGLKLHGEWLTYRAKRRVQELELQRGQVGRLQGRAS